MVLGLQRRSSLRDCDLMQGYIYKYTKIESWHKETMRKLLSNELTEVRYCTD
jgi:hypothetical protein